jgi:hypothetical protein
MGIQPAQAQPTEDIEPLVIQLEIPGDASIFFFEGGIKTAVEEMERTRKFLENSNDANSVEKMNSALSSMQALLDITRQAKSDIIQRAQQTMMAQAMAQAKAAQEGDAVQANFAPRVEPDEDDEEAT